LADGLGWLNAESAWLPPAAVTSHGGPSGDGGDYRGHAPWTQTDSVVSIDPVFVLTGIVDGVELAVFDVDGVGVFTLN
jgi:hypothetical protein